MCRPPQPLNDDIEDADIHDDVNDDTSKGSCRSRKKIIDKATSIFIFSKPFSEVGTRS